MELSLKNINTMSSREIAELTGKKHQHVLRDIDTLNENYEKLALSKIGRSEYKDSTGRTLRAFELTRLQTLDLMTGYSILLRIKVNRRWEELEQAQQKNTLAIPRPLNVHGMEAVSYEHWLLQHGYSLTSGAVRARIRKHPRHFYKHTNGKWYISSAFAKAVLGYREHKRYMDNIPYLPQAVQLDVFNHFAD